MAEIPRIVSVDDHVIEPAHLFERWLPARYRDRGPKSVRKGIAGTTLHGRRAAAQEHRVGRLPA
jgi:hypothetical protein